MNSPHLVLRALSDHWPLVERLVLKSKDTPFLDEDLLERTSLAYCGQNRESADEAIRVLIKREILLSVSNREEYQIHGACRDFILSLSQEHELGLADTIRVEIKEMQRLSESLQASLSENDLSALQIPLNKIGSRMQAIGRQLEQNQQAIMNIADRAKTLPQSTPLEERYREVLDCYEQYIEPMIDMLQIDQGGFTKLTQRIEDQLDKAEVMCEQLGALITWKKKITTTARYLRTLRADARDTLTKCRETLLPLREEYLKNSGIAISVARTLGVVRKKGLANAIPANKLNLGGASRKKRVIPKRFAKAYMADIMHYQPMAVTFPEAPEVTEEMKPLLRFETVLKDIKELQSGNLILPWLLEKYSDQSEKEILRVYHELLRCDKINLNQTDNEVKQTLSEHTLRYYPHSIKGAQ